MKIKNKDKKTFKFHPSTNKFAKYCALGFQFCDEWFWPTLKWLFYILIVGVLGSIIYSIYQDNMRLGIILTIIALLIAAIPIIGAIRYEGYDGRRTNEWKKK